MANRVKLMEDSKLKLRVSLPKLAIHIFIAALIWIFGQLIFVPLAGTFEPLFGFDLGPIISLIIVAALILVLVRVAFELRDTADALAGISAVAASRATTESVHVENYQRGFRGLFYILYAIIIFLFFFTFLATIHPALAGVVLVVIVIWAVVELFYIGSGFSKAVEEWSGRAVNRVERLVVHEAGVRYPPKSPEAPPETEAKPKKR